MSTEENAVLKFPVTVERITKKALNKDAMKEQLKFIADSAKRNEQANWATSIPTKLICEVDKGEGDGREVKYSAVIYVCKERYKDEDAVRRRFAKVLEVMKRAANRKDWRVISDEALKMKPNGDYVVVNGAGEETGDPAPRMLDTVVPAQAKAKTLETHVPDDFVLPELTDEVMAKRFGHIYAREPHIRLIYDNLATAVKSRFKKRNHILLKGKPACAKTVLFLSFIDWLGDDLIEAIDASTMSKAGLERMLLEKSHAGTLKPILILEEIEKCHPENLSCLIQVMDGRGKIQRVNANTVRDGNGEGKCEIILWGTCNNEDQLLKFHSGAIHSRFGVQPECDRPDRTLMERILLDEVADLEGDPAWVEPVLDFCFGELAHNPKFADKYDDPRFAKSLLASGKRLLDTGPKGALADVRNACKIGVK